MLVLGHGRAYAAPGYTVYCSPVPVRTWIRRPYVCVDIDVSTRPDVVFDLRTTPWTFARDAQFSVVIDTTGTQLLPLTAEMRAELLRVLRPGGVYYGRRESFRRSTSLPL